MAEALDDGESIAGMIYLTDLDGRFPSSPERFLDVLWIVPGRTHTKPPFGRLVHMVERSEA